MGWLYIVFLPPIGLWHARSEREDRVIAGPSTIVELECRRERKICSNKANRSARRSETSTQIRDFCPFARLKEWADEPTAQLRRPVLSQCVFQKGIKAANLTLQMIFKQSAPHFKFHDVLPWSMWLFPLHERKEIKLQSPGWFQAQI